MKPVRDSEQKSPPQKRAFGHLRHFRFRFSLRALFIALSLVAAFLGTWVHSVRKQREGIAWVLDQGGHAMYDYEWPEEDGSYPRNAIPPGPKWLRDQLGIDYFAAATTVILDRDEIRDLTPLTNLPCLRCVALMNYVDPQTDFSPLQSLKRLEQLRLDYTGIDVSRLRLIKSALPRCRIESATDPELNN